MSVPSMVHRSGDTLVVRSVVSGDALFGSGDAIAEDTECSDEQTDEKDLPECKIKRNYSCTACDYFTQNPRHYLYHLRDVHKEKVKIYECPNCLYASKHFQKLLRHTKMVHGSTDGVEMPEFSRTKAKKRSSPPEEELQQEEVTQTGDSDGDDDDAEGMEKATLLKCSLCSFTARSQQHLTKHGKEEHIKTKFFRCTKCTYVTHMKARFTKHVKYHSMPMIKCELCDFRTPYKWNLDRHCKNHNGHGAFRCSACNFTADIKQSLTVHEMNHHVPPVGQAAGLGVGRRRNKVGASDATAAEEAAQLSRAEPDSTGDDDGSRKSSPQPKLKIPATKKPKQTPSSLYNPQSDQTTGRNSFGSDFIHPDDIIHHANGNIYIKNKCKLCNFKSAWDGEMAKHEKKAHNIVRNVVAKKKPARPIPNLIPIPSQTSVLKVPKLADANAEPVMSQKDMNDICAKSTNSALKDFASLFGSEDVFKEQPKSAPKVPDLILATITDAQPLKKPKNTSFFDRLGAKLMTENGRTNLTCQYCGHESTCLTHFVHHQKLCGKETIPTHTSKATHVSSTRCQHCRQRCKSSSDLYNHLRTCAARVSDVKKEVVEDERADVSNELAQPPIAVIKTEEPHPMENRVFVWNNIEVPMDIEVDDSHYEYTDDKIEDVSYDLSIRTQSPESENSYVEPEVVQSTVTPDKIPTHGNDISVAQHKRVFKCPHCSFWASTASRFHVHIVGHLNKKPFECSLCAYRSNWRWDITKHIKLKSVRDPAHESAKVLMTDETGRRNYTKYNKYLTEIHMSGDQTETSGGSGTRVKHYDNRERVSPSHLIPSKPELPKLTRAPSSSDFSPLLTRSSPLRPPPPLKAADTFFAKLSEKKRPSADKKTLWKCKKCNFRDPSHEKLLSHVKGHYVQATQSGVQTPEASSSSRSQTPDDRDERHCRLKHGGDIRVVIGSKNGTEKLETDDQAEEPDHVDLPQLGTFKCHKCPFSNDNNDEFEEHLQGHSPKTDSIMKCYYCTYFVSQKHELYEHLKLHGVNEPEEFMVRILEKCVADGEALKRYKCATCPYVTNSKSQYLYHKQFHKPRGGQYACSYCSYNVSKRHLLHQHLKVHGLNMSPQKQNGDVIDLDEISDEIEEIPSTLTTADSQGLPDIPLVWVSKGGKFSKMFKCRFCPHVNLRKVNIQEHEKMHSLREKNPNTSRGTEIEHHCTECNYVCNNAGVLSAHSKVHQGLNGTVHCLVDPTKTDDEQINELGRFINVSEADDIDDEPLEDDSTLYFCSLCPARFLKEAEHGIHAKFHGVRLFYKCEFCTYTARQKQYLMTHAKVHTHEYQERTRELQTLYAVSGEHPPPQLTVLTEQGRIYVSAESEEVEFMRSKPVKNVNVPISGTELYQQRAEAQQKQAENDVLMQLKPADPQFGTLMHGNPEFVYPTYLKNGRMKEKRYKCHKCPSAFEKREQYKIHLGLHGSKQRYKCDHCDYSVKYYANYVQHLKKHQMNSDALAARKSIDSPEENDFESEDSPEKTPLSDQQTSAILQRRTNDVKESPSSDDSKKLFWCPSCPYTNHRKDAVDNHQKRHVSVSGFENNYTCEHCDYSVPQAHFLRDHSKLHFVGNKMYQAEGFMVCEDMRLVGRKVEESSDEGDDSVVFEDGGGRFLPPLGEDVLDRFNNNEGEKQFVNHETGEVVEKGAKVVTKRVDEN